MTNEVSNGPVESLFDDYTNLASELRSSPSGLTALNRSFHKHLVIAAASHLEHQVKALIPDMFERHGGSRLSNFVYKQVMSRGYHTLFDWKQSNANGFFGSFGDDCREYFKECMRADDTLKQQSESFFIIGSERNNLIHNDYASYSIALTPDEISIHYSYASKFVHRFEDVIFGESTGAPHGSLTDP